VSDDRHLGRHPFDGEVDNHQSGIGQSLIPSGSDSPILRVMENLTNRQMSDGPSLRSSFRSSFWAFLFKRDSGDDESSS
ncbi:hypothetical protein HAX54_010159, partial [Datura stramonium]|nr:hypothetical protein [Datura stramonium]